MASNMMFSRFSGGVKELCTVKVDDLVEWVNSIPEDAWPNWVRHPEHKGNFRPSVNADPEWQGMMTKTYPVVNTILANFPGCREADRAITTVLPGDFVPPHTDMHPLEWVVRVHVPITTNPYAQFQSEGVWTHMDVGKAYLVNTEAPHAIRNFGPTPRVHLMFDIVTRFAPRTQML
jgi:hypothetical protein